MEKSLRVDGPADSSVPPNLAYDINADTNIITALICHADGKQPKSVCGRSAIKQVLKHVK